MSEVKAKKFPVDAILKFKHHILRATLKKMNWTQKQMADYLFQHTGLKITASQVSSWVNLSDFPRNELVMQELEVLCGNSREDLFPEFIRDRNFQKMIKSFEKKLELDPDRVYAIIAYQKSLMLLPPDAEVILKERDGLIDKMLSSLSEREEKVLRMRFGLMTDTDKVFTLKEVAEALGFKNTERARQIEAEAIGKIRRRSQTGLFDDLRDNITNPNSLMFQILEKNLTKERR